MIVGLCGYQPLDTTLNVVLRPDRGGEITCSQWAYSRASDNRGATQCFAGLFAGCAAGRRNDHRHTCGMWQLSCQ